LNRACIDHVPEGLKAPSRVILDTFCCRSPRLVWNCSSPSCWSGTCAVNGTTTPSETQGF